MLRQRRASKNRKEPHPCNGTSCRAESQHASSASKQRHGTTPPKAGQNKIATCRCTFTSQTNSENLANSMIIDDPIPRTVGVALWRCRRLSSPCCAVLTTKLKAMNRFQSYTFNVLAPHSKIEFECSWIQNESHCIPCHSSSRTFKTFIITKSFHSASNSLTHHYIGGFE